MGMQDREIIPSIESTGKAEIMFTTTPREPSPYEAALLADLQISTEQVERLTSALREIRGVLKSNTSADRRMDLVLDLAVKALDLDSGD